MEKININARMVGSVLTWVKFVILSVTVRAVMMRNSNCVVSSIYHVDCIKQKNAFEHVENMQNQA